jgi:hypothetical protein
MKQTVKDSLKALMLELEPNRAQFIEIDLKEAIKQIRRNGFYQTYSNMRYNFVSIVKGKAILFNNKQVAAMDCRLAIKYLKERIKPGDTVKTILRHCSRSGMARNISLIHNGVDISYYAAKAMDYTRAADGGLKTGGCGMDMGFSLVYNLSSILFPNGAFIKGAKGKKEAKTNGGYMIKHEWL